MGDGLKRARQAARATRDQPPPRPRSDHGTHKDAVIFALEVHDDPLQTWEFLNAWSHGDLGEWPEYYRWLDARRAPTAPAVGIVHARMFESRWGLGLGYVDTDSSDCEGIRLQLWAPLGDDGVYAKVSMFLQSKPGVPLKRSVEVLASLTDGAFEQAWAEYGMRDMLDRAFGIGGDGVG